MDMGGERLETDVRSSECGGLKHVGVRDGMDDGYVKEMTIGERAAGSKGVPDEIARRYEIVEDVEETDASYMGSYVETKRDNWDCETIVSTYSNLENHPSLLDEPHGGVVSHTHHVLRSP